MATNIFEQASRLRIRFNSPKGSLTVEDLWSLPLTSKTGKANLDDIARGLSKEIKEKAEESFVTPASGPNKALSVAFEIVKHIIAERIVERDAKADAADRAAKKQALLEAIAKAENEQLTTGTLEELKARLATI